MEDSQKLQHQAKSSLSSTNKSSGIVLRGLAKILDAKSDDKLDILFAKAIEAYRNENCEVAFRYFMKAAEQGDPRAQYRIGNCYTSGEGIDADEQQAFNWYLMAAEQGNSGAQSNLSSCYHRGLGVDKNVVEALKWELLANGAQESAKYLGGKVDHQDKNQRLKWLKKAAVLNDIKAQCILAYCYKSGFGVKPDDDNAFYWFFESAEQGYADAQCELGECYFFGNGVDRDTDQACEWYKKAAEQGHERANLFLEVRI